MIRKPVAIIDIGSNSIRLVVYTAASRAPAVVFNEKIMAGLGKSVANGGSISGSSEKRALDALARFHAITRDMGVTRPLVVATAAVRDADNGGAFLKKIADLGLKPRLLSGADEARFAAYGVLSAFPDADGIVGDLGGGSLELINVHDGQIGGAVSLPLGVLKLPELLRAGDAALAKQVRREIEKADIEPLKGNRPFYMVGGSWRTLARIDMALSRYQLPIVHNYMMKPGRAAILRAAVDTIGPESLKAIPSISPARIPTLPHAVALLQVMADALKPSSCIVSSYGIREGLLYDQLGTAIRSEHPLIAATRETGQLLGRFAGHGELLFRWIQPLFDDGRTGRARLRQAACNLSDSAWQTDQEFRAERGVELALHGNWVGIDGRGRVIVAAALAANYGGGAKIAEALTNLCSDRQLKRAQQWGLAMRLAHRLSGGVASILERSRLDVQSGKLCLILRDADAALYGETVERRHRALANALELEPKLVVSRT